MIIFTRKFRPRRDLSHWTLGISKFQRNYNQHPQNNVVYFWRTKHFIDAVSSNIVFLDDFPSKLIRIFVRLGWFRHWNFGLGVIYRTVPSEYQNYEQFAQQKNRKTFWNWSFLFFQRLSQRLTSVSLPPRSKVLERTFPQRLKWRYDLCHINHLYIDIHLYMYAMYTSTWIYNRELMFIWYVHANWHLWIYLNAFIYDLN